MTALPPDAAAPLSVAQEALWYSSVLAPGRVNYNESVAIHRDGPLDPDAMRRALAEIVRRHGAWRTTFDLRDGVPVQLVGPAPVLPLPHLDLSALSSEEAERQARRLTQRLARLPYDLRHGPLVRPRLISFPGHHHRLVLAMHHLAFDMVCVSRVILPELVALYEAQVAGASSPLGDPDATYADYARWEQEWIAGPRAARRLDYWRRRLAGAPALRLPLDRPRPQHRRFRGAIVPLTVPPERVQALRDLGLAVGGSLFHALAAAWALLLSRISGQRDVVFATAADLRQRREFEIVVGYSLTPLVLRVDVDGDSSFTELTRRVRNELLDGLDNLVPFERVVREVDPGRVQEANPIYRTMIVFEPPYQAPDPTWSLHPLSSTVDAAVGGSKLDLELQLQAHPAGHVEGNFIYDVDLFDEATARNLARAWIELVTSASAEPEAPLSTAHSHDGTAGRREVLELNHTRSYAGWGTLHDLVSEGWNDHADRPAIVDGEDTVSYGELLARGTVVADRLRAAGAEEGDVVALLAEPSADLVAGVLGVLGIGGTYLLIDPALAPESRTARLREAGPHVILTDSALGDDAIPEVPLRVEGEAALSEAAYTWARPARPEDVCALVYGREEPAAGVALSHRAIVNLAQSLGAEMAIGPADTVLVLGSTFWEAPAIDLWLALAAGARLVVAPPAACASGAKLSRLIAAHDVTLVRTTPERWEDLLESELKARRGLRAMASGGRLSRDLAERIRSCCRVLWHAYGPLETGGAATLAYLEPGQPVTIGRPVANTEAYVLDDAGQPLPIGAVGELVIAGVGVAAGYVGTDRGERAGRFTSHPLGGSGRAFRTGERARWRPDGELELETALDAAEELLGARAELSAPGS
jgi:non-ribosomal peptide synthetase component F